MIVRSKFVRNLSKLLGGSFFAGLLTIASFFVISRSVGAQDFGLFAIVTAYGIALDKFFSFQSWQMVVKWGSEYINNGDRYQQGKVLGLSILLDIAGMMLVACGGLLVVNVFGHHFFTDESQSNLFLYYTLVACFITPGFALGVLRLTESFSSIALKELLVSLLRLASVLTVVSMGKGVHEVIVVWGLSVIVGWLFLSAMAYRSIHCAGADKVVFEGVFSERSKVVFCIWTNLTSLFTVPTKYLDIFLVSYYGGIDSAGVFKIIKQVGSVLLKSIDLASQVLFPSLSMMYAKRNARVAALYSARLGLTSFSISIIPLTVLVGTADYWLSIFFNSQVLYSYSLIAYYFMFLSILTLFFPVHQLIVASGMVRINFFVAVLTNAVFLVVCWVLGGVVGASSVALALMAQALMSGSIKSLLVFIDVRKNEATNER